MISLDIDTRDLSDEFNLSQQEVNQMLQYTVEEVSANFADTWDVVASQNLGSARNQYKRAIQVMKRDRYTSVVYLNPAAWLPNALEMGHPSFDMKSGFLSSPKVKYTKKGNPYLTIPFRFATPTALGESSAFSGVMPKVIYNEVKKQTRREQLPLTSIPAQYHIPVNAGIRKEVKSGNYSRVTAKTEMTSIYEGMQNTGNGYMTFRRVSLNSQAESWIHPGFQARNFAQKAMNQINIPDIVDISIDNYLAQLGF